MYGYGEINMLNHKKAGTILLVGLLLASMAAPAMAKGGRVGGGRISSGPSISRQAPAPSQRQQAVPSQKQNAGETGTQKKPIDEGIDPKDYGKKPGASGNTTAGTQAGQTAAGTQNNFFGGGSFFGGGFSSFWPWLWISSWFGHGNAAASDGQTQEQPQTTSWWDSLSQWWTNFVQSMKAMLGM